MIAAAKTGAAKVLLYNNPKVKTTIRLPNYSRWRGTQNIMTSQQNIQQDKRNNKNY